MNVLADSLEKYPMLDSLTRYGALKLASIPERLDGKTVLDIGGYDGRFALECLQRGADKAVCLDNNEWNHYYQGTWPNPQRLPGVDYSQGDFLEWQQSYDVVLCFNVLYHTERWKEAAMALRRLTKEVLCLSTYYAAGEEGWVPYTESGTGFLRATPTLRGLLEDLALAGFSQFEYKEVKDDTVVLRCI